MIRPGLSDGAPASRLALALGGLLLMAVLAGCGSSGGGVDTPAASAGSGTGGGAPAASSDWDRMDWDQGDWA